MEKKYSVSKKRQLVAKIGKIKDKKVLCEIYRIIQTHNNTNPKEVNKHLFMFFHDLTEETYIKIGVYLKKYKKDNKKVDIIKESDTIITTDEYNPYTRDDIISQRNLSPKLKYSNKEKSLIKRRIYDNKLTENTENVIYCKYDTPSTPSTPIMEYDANNKKKVDTKLSKHIML
jgi:hypothetical protein